MNPAALAILAPVVSLAVGVLLGAWVHHCAASGKSPLPALPANPFRKKRPAPEGDEDFPQRRSAKL